LCVAAVKHFASASACGFLHPPQPAQALTTSGIQQFTTTPILVGKIFNISFYSIKEHGLVCLNG